MTEPFYITEGRDGNSDNLQQPSLTPDCDAVAWAILQELHSNIPEDKRPLSWSDLSDEQAARIRRAAKAAISINSGQVDKLRSVLRKHHQWHLNIGTVVLSEEDKDGNKQTYELNLSSEYGDSTLCDETLDALR
jgi:hypothetical protein